MADFGPEVFHALAMMADRDRDFRFRSQDDPRKCGFEHCEDGKPTVDSVERLKNFIFYMVMIRARNTLYIAKKQGIPNVGNCVVDLSFMFDSSVLHDPLPWDHSGIDLERIELNANIENIPAQVNVMPGGNGNLFASEIDRVLKDSSAAMEVGRVFAAVCGGANNFRTVFGGNSEDFDTIINTPSPIEKKP